MSALGTRIRALLSGIVVRLLLYYVAVFLLGWSTWNVLPAGPREFFARNLSPVLGTVQPTGDPMAPFPAAVGAGTGATHEVAILAAIVGCMAVALALPMAWVYMYTRQRKGYQQSVVHTIVLLPPVVAAVSLLVRNNIGLAFSLAGIVAAVRFRTSLDDSKDAVFIFAVSALGLACGVNIEFAAALSMLFSAIALGLWYTDFGRTPPDMEGARAEQHMQRALAIANRTSQFVARVDREILEGLGPAQLDALAQRVRKRRGQVAEGEREWDCRIVVFITDDEGRSLVERILSERTKSFEFTRAEFLDGKTRLTYHVRTRKALRADELAEVIARDGLPYVDAATVEGLGA